MALDRLGEPVPVLDDQRLVEAEGPVQLATAAGVAASWPRMVAAGLLLDSAPRQ